MNPSPQPAAGTAHYNICNFPTRTEFFPSGYASALEGTCNYAAREMRVSIKFTKMKVD